MISQSAIGMIYIVFYSNFEIYNSVFLKKYPDDDFHMSKQVTGYSVRFTYQNAVIIPVNTDITTGCITSQKCILY